MAAVRPTRGTGHERPNHNPPLALLTWLAGSVATCSDPAVSMLPMEVWACCTHVVCMEQRKCECKRLTKRDSRGGGGGGEDRDKRDRETEGEMLRKSVCVCVCVCVCMHACMCAHMHVFVCVRERKWEWMTEQEKKQIRLGNRWRGRRNERKQVRQTWETNKNRWTIRQTQKKKRRQWRNNKTRKQTVTYVR